MRMMMRRRMVQMMKIEMKIFMVEASFQRWTSKHEAENLLDPSVKQISWWNGIIYVHPKMQGFETSKIHKLINFISIMFPKYVKLLTIFGFGLNVKIAPLCKAFYWQFSFKLWIVKKHIFYYLGVGLAANDDLIFMVKQNPNSSGEIKEAPVAPMS